VIGEKRRREGGASGEKLLVDGVEFVDAVDGVESRGVALAGEGDLSGAV
jgi:hypothetical protein